MNVSDFVCSDKSGKTAPCKGCEERHHGCHSHCEAYKAYQAENTKRCEENIQTNKLKEYQRDRYARYQKKPKWR